MYCHTVGHPVWKVPLSFTSRRNPTNLFRKRSAETKSNSTSLVMQGREYNASRASILIVYDIIPSCVYYCSIDTLFLLISLIYDCQKQSSPFTLSQTNIISCIRSHYCVLVPVYLSISNKESIDIPEKREVTMCYLSRKTAMSAVYM